MLQFHLRNTNVFVRSTKLEKEKIFFIVDSIVLPEIFLQVIKVKKLIENNSCKTIQDAVSKVGISRSAFYKYKDSVFPLYENTRGRTVTIAITLDDRAGILSIILNDIADSGANILTINQNIPLNNIANITITIETGNMKKDLGELIEQIKLITGVQNLKIIARE